MNSPMQAEYPEFYRNAQVELSVVIPLLNETEVLGLLYQRLKDVITPFCITYELLIVDDGSSDSSAEALLNISHDDPLVTVVLLTRYFGKEAALIANWRRQVAELSSPWTVTFRPPRTNSQNANGLARRS